MSFFESLLLLLLAAILLLQVSRRLGLPYPAMLAVVGVAVGFIPGAPRIEIDPATLLALFIAPVLLDAAYDFPLRAAGRLWRPLVLLAVVAVLATTALVAWIGWAVAGLPIAAAITLGAIVAPPDAAAATAVLGTVALPRRTVAVLKGESLFNDATALMLFTGALAMQAEGGMDGRLAAMLALEVPGGLLLGVASGYAMRWLNGLLSGTLGGNLLQFLNAFLVWIVAEHLHLSAVLAVVACAMTVARGPETRGAPRMRVHSFAVWATVVFLLNVLAFLLMGMQAHAIIGRLSPPELAGAMRLAALVIAGAIVTRLVVVMGWSLLARRFAVLRGGLPAPGLRQGFLVGWCGMRGMVSLATAFALPADFPQRDIVVLTAFSVVLATLVVQGLTLTPIIRLLRLHEVEDPSKEIAEARAGLVSAGLAHLDRAAPPASPMVRDLYALKAAAAHDPDARAQLKGYRVAGLDLIAEQRRTLAAMRDEERVGMDNYYLLQEELDWRELTLLPEEERRIEDG